MTLVFQLVAVGVIAVAAFFLFRSGGARHQALRRLLMLLFIAGAASSVFFPQIWTWMANLVGVGRGTDLLLYFLVLIFIGFVATTYRRFRQIDKEMTKLARQVALSDPTAPAAPLPASPAASTPKSRPKQGKTE